MERIPRARKLVRSCAIVKVAQEEWCLPLRLAPRTHLEMEIVCADFLDEASLHQKTQKYFFASSCAESGRGVRPTWEANRHVRGKCIRSPGGLPPSPWTCRKSDLCSGRRCLADSSRTWGSVPKPHRYVLETGRRLCSL